METGREIKEFEDKKLKYICEETVYNINGTEISFKIFIDRCEMYIQESQIGGFTYTKNLIDDNFISKIASNLVNSNVFEKSNEAKHYLTTNDYFNKFNILINNLNSVINSEKKNILETTANFNGSIIKELIFKGLREEATEMIVQEILRNENIYSLRDDDKSEIWIYRNGIYIPDGKTYIKEFTRKVLDSLFTSQICNDVINKIEADTYIISEEFFVDENPRYLAVQNGILDVFEKDLQPFTPKKFFFQKIPIEYNSEAKCEFIKKFFKQILHPEDVNVMQELFGYLLFRDYKFEKAFMFNGGGRNGKGKTVELMKRFLGIKNCSNISLQRLEKDNFAMGELHNKLANLSADISYSALNETGTFKSLTGHDMISAPRKFRTDVTFTNYAKMIFCANELPRTSDITLAFFNRWILIDFPFTFLLSSDYEKRKHEDTVKLADKEIINKLSKKEEIQGLLVWALEGLNRLFKKSDFSISRSTEDTKGMWIKRSDSFTAFCSECLESCWEGSVPKKDLTKYYSLYCRENKLRTFGDKHIKGVLGREFGASEDRLNDGERTSVWVGINIKPEIIEFINKQIQNKEKEIRLFDKKSKNNDNDNKLVGQEKQGFSESTEISNFDIGVKNPVFPVKSSLFIKQKEKVDKKVSHLQDDRVTTIKELEDYLCKIGVKSHYFVTKINTWINFGEILKFGANKYLIEDEKLLQNMKNFRKKDEK